MRSSFVEDLIQTRTFTNVSKITKMGLIFFMPFYTMPGIILFMNAEVTPEGVCVLVNSTAWFTIFFVVGTVLLSGITTYLFAAPLLSVVNGRSQSLRRLMYRNVVLNVIAMSGTMTFISCFTYFNHSNPIANTAGPVISLAFAAADMFLVGICARLMIMAEPRWNEWRCCRRRRCQSCRSRCTTTNNNYPNNHDIEMQETAATFPTVMASAVVSM